MDERLIMNLRLPHSDPDHPSLVGRMLASPGRTLVPVALSLAIITVMIGAIAYGGTNAFFSDTETATANVFAAGDITHWNGKDL